VTDKNIVTSKRGSDEGKPCPLLSVTVTNYNYGRFLSKNIESILCQTFTDFELIIIDNASNDASLSIIQRHAERDSRIRLIAHDWNVGMLESLRESCDVAQGRYRVHVDADDWVISTDAFQRQIDVLEANPRMSFAYSSLTLFGPDEKKTNVSHPYPKDTVLPGELALEAILGFNTNHSGMMLRLDAYRQCGGYPDGFVMCLDILLAVRLCEHGDVGFLDQELYAFRQHGANDHLALRLRGIRDEILPVIGAAFDGPLCGKLKNPAAVRRRVLRRALVHVPTQNIFSGHVRLGWRMYWESVKVRPLETVFQRRTISLVARTLLGSAGFTKVVKGVRRLRHLGAPGEMTADSEADD
jgi:glycosyltransferase involved in cell wall biosynthesis